MEEREMVLSQGIEVEKCCLKKSKIILNPYISWNSLLIVPNIENPAFQRRHFE
jgi:hypothetical protein